MQSLSEISYLFLKETVAKAMEDYELRESQIEMLKACSSAIEDGGILMAEAGTGTGKTFAYLIPLILSQKRAIVSTRTINLQEQLVLKDLKFLSSLYQFDYAIAKGRGNYLCLRRLNAFRHESDEESAEYRKILTWASMTDDGDIESYGSKRPSIWGKVFSDSDACKGKKCGHFSQCFYFRARQKWANAQILVSNHALTAINAMLSEESKILPRADVLVIDEGHSLDNVLSEQIGINLSKRGFENILNRLLKLDERGNYKGLLSADPGLFSVIESLRADMELFWMHMKNELKNREAIRGVFIFRDLMHSLSDSIKSLTKNVHVSTLRLFQEDDELELKAFLSKLNGFADDMKTFSEGMDDFVRWADIEDNRISLRMSPIYPNDFIRENILPEYSFVIMTSATLSVSGDFGFAEKILGLKGSKKLRVPSPFDLKNQVSIEIKKGINLLNGEGHNKLAEVIIGETLKKDGGILVLFTSREAMKKVWDLSSEGIRNAGFNPMMQGDLSSNTIINIMRSSENSVIFGLDSFWEGIDVKGDSLKCLIITKLPFEVPTEPIAMARTEEIKQNGGNPFYEYSLPKAILKFKQGFGRLIRSKTDKGRVIICDERIETQYYGRRFIENIL